jgi:hypothetical protein
LPIADWLLTVELSIPPQFLLTLRFTNRYWCLMNILSKKVLAVIGLLAVAFMIFIFGTGSKTVDFNTEVKPIFNKKCITCHGGVEENQDSVYCSAPMPWLKISRVNQP